MSCDSPQADALPPISIIASLPAWLLSLAIHLLIAITGSLLVRAAIIPTHDESPRAAEIVLARRAADHTEYFADESTSARHSALKPIGAEGATSLVAGGDTSTSDRPPFIAGISLPDLSGNLPVGETSIASPQLGAPSGQPRLPTNPLDEAAILAEDALIPREI